MSSAALAPVPASFGPARAHRWGYHSALKTLPVEWELSARDYARQATTTCVDPEYRERLTHLIYCLRWADYLAALRARHVNWALAVEGGHLGHAMRLLFRYPATERAYYRARTRILNLVCRAIRSVLERLKQLNCPISPVRRPAKPVAFEQYRPQVVETTSPLARARARLHRCAHRVRGLFRRFFSPPRI
jgi:hypothetical protein